MDCVDFINLCDDSSHVIIPLDIFRIFLLLRFMTAVLRMSGPAAEGRQKSLYANDNAIELRPAKYSNFTKIYTPGVKSQGHDIVKDLLISLLMQLQ